MLVSHPKAQEAARRDVCWASPLPSASTRRPGPWGGGVARKGLERQGFRGRGKRLL